MMETWAVVFKKSLYHFYCFFQCQQFFIADVVTASERKNFYCYLEQAHLA